MNPRSVYSGYSSETTALPSKQTKKEQLLDVYARCVQDTIRADKAAQRAREEQTRANTAENAAFDAMVKHDRELREGKA